MALTAGAAISHGIMIGMLRAAYNDGLSWDLPNSGVQDYAALAGLRSRGEYLFWLGALGIARATPIGGENDLYSLHPDRQFAVAYDLSTHEVYRLAGVGIALTGVVGSARVTYVALSIDAELGWFGSR